MKAVRLSGLDGLRGIAALCVLIYHSAMIATGTVHGNAYLAVDFFFMLSGFVMARAYEHRFDAGFGALDFLCARITRLWPVMAVGGLLGLPMLVARLGPETGWVAALNMVMIPTPLGNAIFPLNTPAWSIFFELVANLVHVALLRRLPTRALAIVLVPLAVLMGWVATRGSIDVGSAPTGFWLGIPRVLLSYGIGVLIWRTCGVTAPIRVSRAATFGTMPALFAAIALLGVHSGPFDMLFVLLVSPALIIGGLSQTNVSPLATVAGAMSFPLYAVHMPILEASDWAGLGVGMGMALSIAVAAMLAYLPTRARRLGPRLAPIEIASPAPASTPPNRARRRSRS